MMRWGTSHFQTMGAAIAYYRPYGFDAADVQRKLDAGEIHLGAPRVNPGNRAILGSDGRFWIEDNCGAWDE